MNILCGQTSAHEEEEESGCVAVQQEKDKRNEQESK